MFFKSNEMRNQERNEERNLPGFSVFSPPIHFLPMNKSVFFRNLAVACGLAASAMQISAQVAPAFFLNDTIIRNIPAKDLPSFRSALGSVLESPQDGVAKSWSSTSAVASKAIKVVLTPLQTAQTKSANTCRLVKADVARGSQTENWQFWFCKQSDGAWKASGSSTPR